MIQEAEAYKEKVIADSEGEADRFTKLLVEYQRAPEVTRERLYIEAMEDVYLNSNKVLMGSEGNGSLLYLPIDKLIQNNPKQDRSEITINKGQAIENRQQMNQNQDSRMRRVR